MIRVAALLLLVTSASATVIDGRGDIVWGWVWDYDRFVETGPTAEEHLQYCRERKDKANDAVNALWALERLAAPLDMPLDTYAQAVGTAHLALRYFARCEWQQRQIIERQAAERAE